MKDIFIERKDMLKEYSLNSNLTNDAVIYKMINNNTLDFLIKKIDNRKTLTNTKCIVKKGYLTSNEQFIDLLNNFIMIFDDDFNYIGKYSTSILEIILNYEKNYKFLLSKNYWGNNDFIPYFRYNIKKYVVTGFYNNLKYLFSDSESIKSLLSQNNIKIQKTYLSHDKDVERIYEL